MSNHAGYWRSIPACAGGPRPTRLVKFTQAVYPRVRGGTRFAVLTSQPVPGLSPRARGNHIEAIQRNVSSRSIPACAGEPTICVPCMQGDQVYPRVRGGTRTDARRYGEVAGLSPRARGNLAGDDDVIGVHGSIPACAGEPLQTTHAQRTEKVYPRVRGGT